MPKFTHFIPVPGKDANDLLAIVYGTFLHLEWEPKFAGENRIIGYTPKSWKAHSLEITADINEGILEVTSNMIHGESFDMTGKNRKHVTTFLNTFEVLLPVDEDTLQEWKNAVAQLQQETLVIAEQQRKEQEELDTVMNLSKGSKTVTYTLIGINVLVFIAMVINGVGIFEPTTSDLIKWGANFKPYTLDGQWWRVITCVFVHIGIIHILFNMYALYMIGVYLEPLLGKVRYIAAYLCTGVYASLTSIWWHDDVQVSAGASGAIFGLYGVFLALLTTKLIPSKTRKALLQSIGVFVFYNLAYGMKAGVDNAAHMGGLLSGFLAGYFFFPTLKNQSARKSVVVSFLIVILTIGLSSFYIKNAHSDTSAFIHDLDNYSKKEELALSMRRANLSQDQLLKQMINVSLPTWLANKKLLAESEKYKLNKALTTQRTLLEEYTDLRIREAEIIISILKRDNDSKTEKELSDVQQKIEQKLKELKQP